MAQPMTAHSSFFYLVENIPDWQKEVDLLTERASAKNGEFRADYTRLVNQIKTRRKKSPSITSIHTLDDFERPSSEHASLGAPTDTKDLPSPPDCLEIDPLEAGNRHLYSQSRRKRKTGPSVRSGASGPPKSRAKNQVVVYYDGFLQEHLDALVKQVGSGRNNLRKGKNALVAAQGFKLPSLTRPTAPGYTSIEDIRSTLTSRSTPGLLAGKKLALTVQPDTPDHETAFLRVDKELESVQSLCEVAAHQFLRDGDCQTEMASIKQKLRDILGRATATAEDLKKLADEQSSHISNVQGDTQHGASDYSPPSTFALEPSWAHPHKLNSQPPHAINNTLNDMTARGMFFSAPDISFGSPQAPIVADDIEVDDESDQEDILVDITAFRLAKARQTRV
ncbi:uncharacterized protein A1O9_08280 [Exophiala aquamarina CBS 119918]|uniref:Uncharacterized protein n=1 Tax=Exophiala aquamarina CBS 119918 TaxID=1182545 RepID=A0A072PJ13_9EURO|nr:uncharacterized protein A1O9_08280 [Exophiala aquamarina CBS 119918]KEF55530.1 hypothetical protein A1O9_08280 [Exophiala aquamarina CBS 119918]